MKIVIVDKSNVNQKKYLTSEGKWDHRIKNAKDWDIEEGRKKIKELRETNSSIQLEAY